MPTPFQSSPELDILKAGPDSPAAPGPAGPGEELRIARALVNGFMANVPYCVYFKNRQSQFIALSQSMAALFRVKDAKEVVGRTDFDFFTEQHARSALADEQQIMKTGKPVIGKLEKESWPDGRVTWALTSKLPLRDAGGEIIGTFGLSKDMTREAVNKTALENARRDLMDASRVAGMAEVATDVLHSVGTVLSSLNVSASCRRFNGAVLKSSGLLVS